MAARKPKEAVALEPVAHQSLGEALLAFQAEPVIISKTDKNPHFSSTYAGLPGIMEAVRPFLLRHGLALIQVLDQTSTGAPALRTVLMHPASDQMIEGTCGIPEGNLKNAQQMGSAVTYFRRYGVLAVLGLVAGADDDGNAAVAGTPETRASVTVPGATITTLPDGGTITAPAGALPAAETPGIGGGLVL